MNTAQENNMQRSGNGRGFAGMDPEKRKRIAREGGMAAHRKGTAHEWTSQEAAAAGRKGGQISGRKRSIEKETPQL